MSWRCPLCHAALQQNHTYLSCPNGHQFDRAKEGYVNLLPVQHKRSRDPGDNGDMIQARRAFLNAGHYQPLRDHIAKHLAELSPSSLLDIGCGEGYYTYAFAETARQTFGLDVSKTAIRIAAKRYPAVQFCVASSQHLPFDDNSLDAVVRIYAPCNPEELARVVRSGGQVMTATPGPRHLMELKGLIYDEVRLHAPHSEQLAGFRLVGEEAMAYPMTLSGQEAAALLQMTPFAWRASQDVWQQLKALSQFLCQTDFSLHIWQRED